MTTGVLFEQSLAGPPAGRDDALASLKAARFTVRAPESGPYGNDGNAWLIVETVMQSPPTGDDQVALMARAADASSRYGFELRMHSVVWSLPDGGV